MPPIGSTRPDSVISPVIATSARTGTPRAAETIAVAIVTPAEGPSFGIAPAGTWMCTSCLVSISGAMPSDGGHLPHVAERGARRLLHHAAELARQRQVPVAAGEQHRFDVQDVAADLGPRQARGDARTREAERAVGSEARRSQVVRHVLGRHVPDVGRIGRDLRGHLPRDRADLPFERAHAGFTRVLRNHAPQRLVVDDQLLGRQPVLLALPRDEVHLRDVDLLLLGVAAELR